MKEPQDHKKKSANPKVVTAENGKRVTISGKSVTVTNDALDDWELLEDLSDLQNGKGQRITSIAKRMFGDDYKPALEQFRGTNGRVKASEFTKFVQEVVFALNPES